MKTRLELLQFDLPYMTKIIDHSNYIIVMCTSKYGWSNNFKNRIIQTISKHGFIINCQSNLEIKCH
jgi:hypothetical protein